MERSRYYKLMSIARKSMLKSYMFSSIDFYQYSRMQLGLDPLQLAVLPYRTQFLVTVSPVSRYPGEAREGAVGPRGVLRTGTRDATMRGCRQGRGTASD